MKSLRVVSLMSESQDVFCEQLTFYAAARLGVTAELIADVAWQEREALLDAGQVDLAWICGLQYARKRRDLRPIAAPVMAHLRYQNKPVYFSDVIVRRDSAFVNFADLRGAACAFNEPKSHSGVNIVLAQGLDEQFFGRKLATGAHTASIAAVGDGLADWAAIDSTVYDLARQQNPTLNQTLRVITTLGPSPMPPFVVTSRAMHFAAQLRAVLVGMEAEEDGRAILGRVGMRRLAAVSDADYQLIDHCV